MNPDKMNDEQFLEYYKGHMFAYAQIIGSGEYLDDRPTIESIKKLAKKYGSRYDEIMSQYDPKA